MDNSRDHTSTLSPFNLRSNQILNVETSVIDYNTVMSTDSTNHTVFRAVGNVISGDKDAVKFFRQQSTLPDEVVQDVAALLKDPQQHVRSAAVEFFRQQLLCFRKLVSMLTIDSYDYPSTIPAENSKAEH
jgi:hypothetical protein